MPREQTTANAALRARDACSLPAEEVMRRLGTSSEGISLTEANRRRLRIGPNAVRTHHVRPFAVLVRQLRSPLLALLVIAATVSYFVGERTDALIIATIVVLSAGLGFVNEFRAEAAAAALHSQLRLRATVRRDGAWGTCDVTELVPGDLVHLEMGAMVPADLRIIRATGLECDEAMLTGESLPVPKDPAPTEPGAPLAEMTSCAFMGTIVRAGSGDAVVVATGGTTEFGRIALDLGERQAETEFQVGLRHFSMLLARVAGVLTVVIFAINLVLSRPLIDALLFSLAIAVGITPQLLPAVVTTSLATGSRRLSRCKVLVKRLVCIEDLGNVEVLLTDKTGTLTEGAITFRSSFGSDAAPSEHTLLLGLLCNEASVEGRTAVGGNPLDIALWNAPAAEQIRIDGFTRIATLPFDHDRRRVSVLVDGPDGRTLITKGAPEGILPLCNDVTDTARRSLDRAFGEGGRVVAVASRPATDLGSVTIDDERDLVLDGLLVFSDEPKESAARALRRLADLGIAVRVVTGDNPLVAEYVCDRLGLGGGATLTGEEIDRLDDAQLTARLATTRVFARVDPEQKTRIIRLHRLAGTDVAYLGDGVNDAVALHAADVGISVDTATDVARDAADIVLLAKDLDVLADGVVEGRRIFANTIKYVLMGTSSNFGNMCSAAIASAFLGFLPMLPSQILLNNLLYDTGQMAIPSDRVDEEQLARPAHWEIGFIQRFMLFFGPISSVFDFATFAVMLHLFHAGPSLFRSGWFVESLATQALVIFVIRTRRPFWKSTPGRWVVGSTAAVVLIGALLPMSPLARDLGFARLPIGFFASLVSMVGAYLWLVELGKRRFYARVLRHPARRSSAHERRVHRRAARFSHGGPLSPGGRANPR